MGAGSRRRRLTPATGWMTSIGASVLSAALVAAVLSHPARTSGAIVSERGASSKVSGDVDAPRPAIERLRRPPNPQQGGGPGPAGPGISLATYLGSELADGIVAVESDASGNVFVFGTVPDNATFLSWSPWQFTGPQALSGTNDCFLAKLVPDPAADYLAPEYFALIHDTGRCDAMTIAPTGDVYTARTIADSAVVIEQYSNASGTLQRTNSFDLPHLARVTHLRVDDQGNSYVVGECANESSAGDLWPLPNGFQPGPAFFNPACVDSSQAGQPGGQFLMVKAGPQGQVFHGSFFGFDASTIEPTSVELDALGRLYIAGHTNVGVGPTILTTFNAFMLQPGDAFCTPNTPDCEWGDAFLIVFDTRFQGNPSYAYASYLGGTDRESDVAMALAPDGRVHLVGTTQSATTFPGLAFGTNTAIFDLVIDPDQAPVDQLIRSGTIVEGLAASVWYSHESGGRFRLRPNGTYALLASSDDPTFPLVEPLFDDPRDPNAFGEMKARLLVYDPFNDNLVLSTYLDDVTLAHRAHLASAASGALYVGMLTTETSRSTSTTAIGQDDVLVFAIDGIEAAVNDPPVANAGADQTVVVGTPVHLYGGASIDPDGDPLTYVWTEGPTVLGTDVFIQVSLTQGDHVITLTVDDGRGGVDADTVTVHVLPNTTAGGPQTVTPPDQTRNPFYLASPVTIHFDNVTSTGSTTLTSRYVLNPVPPPGMQFGSPPLHYDLATTAGFTGNVQVCIDYRGQSFARPVGDLQLYQQVNGTWALLSQNNDTAARSVCGTTTTLGTFALFTPAVAANEITLLAGQPVRTQHCTRTPGTDPNEGGFATGSTLCNTRGLAFDAARNYLYFAESWQTDAIRRIDLTTGRITTVAGTGFTTGALDGTGGDPRDDDKNDVDPLTAPLNQVLRIALDAQGNLILAEYGAGRLRKVDFAQNRIYTIADVLGLTQPSALAIDSAGAALFSSFAFGAPVIWRLTPGADAVLNGSPDEALQVVAGNGIRNFDPNQIPAAGIDPRQFPVETYALAFGPDGSLYATGQNGGAVLRITPGPDGFIDGVDDTMFRVAGGGLSTDPHYGDGGAATNAWLFHPIAIAVAANGDVYVGDTGNSFGAKVRRISAVDGVVTGAPDEIITTVGGFHIYDEAFFNGNPLPYSDGDGHALSSIFGASFDLLVMPNGNVVVNDYWQVRRIGPRNPSGDTTPPVLTLPAPMVVEAESPGGTGVTFAASAIDDVDGPVAVSCSPPSGSLFGFTGTAPTSTTVTCSATDAAGNTATGTFTVTVQDTTPPAVTAPGPITVAATEATGARANVPQAPDTLLLLDFLAAGSATDIADVSPQRLAAQRVDCGTPSAVLAPIAADTRFDLGQNCIEVAFTDASGNVGRSLAIVDVSPPIGGHVNDPGMDVTATDMNRVPQPVTANFIVLQQRGLLRAVPTAPPAGPPAGLMFHGIAYDVTTTALAPTAISVCVTLQPPFGPLQPGDRLLLFENGTWVDRTASVDVSASRICGLPTSLGIYAIARSAVVSIRVEETILVTDTPNVLPSAMIGVTEQIVVNDATGVLPSAMVAVTEQIVVHDGPQVEPQAVLSLTLLPASGTHAVGDQASITAHVSDGSDEATRVVLTTHGSPTVRVQFVGSTVPNSPLSVTVTSGNPLGGSDVIVSLATSATGALSSTAAQVAAALNASPASAALLSAQTWPGNPGLGLARPRPLTALTSVNFTIDGAATSTETCLTGVPGLCSISYTRMTAGTDQLLAYLDVNGNGTLQPDEPTAFALSTWFDDAAPVLSLPGSVVTEAEAPGGTVVTFTASATDNSSAPVTVACSPASGSLFPFNGSSPTTTQVTCVATDAAGNAANGSFDVVVRDTTAPQVTTAHITVAATEALGARGNVPQAPHTFILQQIPLLAAALDAGDPNPARVSVQWVLCGNPAQVLGPIADSTLYFVGLNCFYYVFRDASGNGGTGIGTIEVSPPIGGHINVPNVPVTATDLNNVPLPVTATYLGLDQPGLLTALPPQFIPPPPTGLIFAGAPLELHSTALAQAPVVVCMRPPFGDVGERLLTLEFFQWVDRTETFTPAGEVCGRPGELGTFALVRRDLSDLILSMAPASAVRSPGQPLRLDAVVADSSPIEARVAINSTVDVNVEFRNPMVPNSPLSLIIQNNSSGALQNLIVSLATGPAGDLRSTAADVANLITGEFASRVGPGLVSATWWPETRGEGIVEPKPLLRLARLAMVSDSFGPLASCYISTPGFCSHEYIRHAPATELVSATLDLNHNGVTDGGELSAATVVAWDAPPLLYVPANMTVPADAPAGSAVLYGVFAEDGVGGDHLPVVCSPASGSIFPIGTTTVTCTTEDPAGQVVTGSFTITVVVGTASIPFQITGKGRDASGLFFIRVRIENVGTGHAKNLNINSLAFKTLTGTGVVTPAIALPIALGNLDAGPHGGAIALFTIYLNVPATVRRFSISESGTFQNVLGATGNFSASQAVFP